LPYLQILRCDDRLLEFILGLDIWNTIIEKMRNYRRVVYFIDYFSQFIGTLTKKLSIFNINSLLYMSFKINDMDV
jgi:hypothetical protein